MSSLVPNSRTSDELVDYGEQKKSLKQQLLPSTSSIRDGVIAASVAIIGNTGVKMKSGKIKTINLPVLIVGISDAGDALRACLESGVDVVICGHKHRPWMWNLGKLLIVFAGTACSWRYRGVFDDTYNIIDINNNKVHVDIKLVGGRKIPLSEIVKSFKQEVRTQALSS